MVFQDLNFLQDIRMRASFPGRAAVTIVDRAGPVYTDSYQELILCQVGSQFIVEQAGIGLQPKRFFFSRLSVCWSVFR